MARSKNYKIEVEYDARSGYSDELWTIVVSTRSGLFSVWVGSKTLRREPSDDEVLTVGRELIDDYLLLMEKSKGRKFNVRHP